MPTPDNRLGSVDGSGTAVALPLSVVVTDTGSPVEKLVKTALSSRTSRSHELTIS